MLPHAQPVFSRFKFGAYFASAGFFPSLSQATKASPQILSFSSTLCNGSVSFNSMATSFTLTGSPSGAGLVIGALEDDDNDDKAVGNFDWCYLSEINPNNTV